MEFVKLLPICHPESAILDVNRNIYCDLCKKIVIVDIFEYVRQPFDDHFYGAALAQALYECTGNDQVPLPFTVVDIDGILPKRVTGQTLQHVRKCIEFLRAINAPFTTNPSHKMCPEMGQFMTDYLKMVDSDHTLLNQLIQGMHQVLNADKEFSNPFEFYFSKLVPYTQKCIDGWKPLQAMPPDANLAKELWIQLSQSNAIRKMFGIYCIPFDAIHAMVASYACCSDPDMVGNWVLDLMARICSGNYFWQRYRDCIFVKTMQNVLKTEVTLRNHMALYHTMRQFQNGNAIDCISTQWTNYLQLAKLVHSKFHVPQTTYDVNELACNQMFPAVLFENQGDLFGFILSSTHLMMSVDPKRAMVPKGAFKKAREIHRIVKRFVDSVFRFNQPIWTLDTLQLFLAAEPNLEREISEVFRLLITQEE